MTNMKEQLSQLSKTSKKNVALYHKVAVSMGISDCALGVLYALFDSNAPVSQYDLCNEQSIAKQTVNSAVAALLKKGLISMSPISGTKNKKSITLTEAGREFAGETIGKLQKAETEALAVLTPEEIALYISLNEKYNSALSDNIHRYVGTGELWT